MTYTPSTSIGTIWAHSSSTVPPAAFSHSELPIPTDATGNRIYDNTGDPMLAANVYDGGVWPKRVYAAGMLFSARPSGGQNYLPSGIGLWHSDDGGQSWSLPSGVAWENGGGRLLDKPAVAVSYYSGTLGHVYVAWANADSVTPTNSQLWVARSTDGGASFEQPVLISWDDVNRASLAVDSNTGTVYITWVNFTFGDIRVAQSSGTGSVLYFPSHSIVSGGPLTASINGVRAPTVPIARYNWITQRLMVTWHGDNGGQQDVFYSFYPCQSPKPCNSYGWLSRWSFAQDSAYDQFEPAFDYDRNGDVVASFYSRPDNDPNVLYFEYVAKFRSDGSRIAGVNDVRVSWPCNCPSNPKFANTYTVDPNFIGDYQDAWIWAYSDGDRLVSAFVRVDQANNKVGDVYVTRTAP